MNETLEETAWMYDTTQPRRVVKPQSLLARVIQQDKTELDRAQREVEKRLLEWPDGLVWSKKGNIYEQHC